MITEELMENILSASIINKTVKYKCIQDEINIKGVEPEDKVYFTFYIEDLEDGKIGSALIFNTKEGKEERFEGKYIDIAESLLRGTDTKQVVIGDILIPIEEFDFTQAKEDING